MKERALEIVSKLIDQNKISGQEAVTLIQSIIGPAGCSGSPIVIDSIKPQPVTSEINDVIIQPYSTSITSSDKGMEIIYG